MAKHVLRLTTGAATGGEGHADEEINLRELWRTLWRRKAILLACVALITGGAWLYVVQQTPLYSAETMIRIQTRDAQVVNLPGVVDELVADPATIESEIEVIRSRALARRVVERLGLAGDPEFNVALRPAAEPFWVAWGLEAYLPEMVRAWLAPMAVAGQWAAPAADPAADDEHERLQVVDVFLDRLRVSQVGRSHVLQVRFLAEQPAKAAHIADGVAEAYIATQLEQKYAAAERAAAWLRQRIEELRAEVVDAETRIAAYRAEYRLADGDRASPVTMQIGHLNNQLALAQAQRAEAEARRSQLRGLLAAAGGLEAAAKVLNSPLMASLRAEESQLQRQLSELSTIYGDLHPQMVNVRAELEGVREKMVEEVERIDRELEDEVAVARARERELARSLSALEGEAAGQGEAEVQLRDLQRDAETNRLLFEGFLQRFREIVEGQDLQRPDAQILSSADAPAEPAYPRARGLLAVAFGSSLVLGMLMVFVVERWDAGFGFRSAEEIEAATGLGVLALVPDLGRRETGGASEAYVLNKPASAFAEAVQRVRTGLFLVENELPPRAVLITSSMPLEGKSLLALSLVRQSARSGIRALLVDADLRRPRLHHVVGVPNRDGLADILTGRIDAEEAIRIDEVSGMAFVPAGTGALSPPDLFRSLAMKAFLQAMTARYDLVVLDSPPVAAVSDSLILAGLVDRTVYLVRWEQTPRGVAVAGLRKVAEAGANLAGVVLSRVDVRKHARYGYADSGYYTGAYSKYYTD